MATITEDYCSKGIYKLLIEKGFDGEVHTTFDEEGYTQPSITLQMAMKWLREVHNIYLNINVRVILGQWSGYDISIHAIDNDGFLNKKIPIVLNDNTSYEQACEAAIKYCLENLI